MIQFLKTEKKIFIRTITSSLVLVCGAYATIRAQDFFATDRTIRIGIVALLFAVMIVAIWWKNNLSDKANIIASIICCCGTPLACYVMLECANSEWSALFVEGAGLSMKLHLFNSLIYVYFILFVLCISASFRVAEITSFAFFGLLGAAMHYVCVFRGMGFVATDFYSFGAAMEVAGAYSFAPDYWMYVSLLICLAGIIVCSRFNGNVHLKRKERAVAMLCSLLVAGVFYLTFFKLPYTKDMKVKLFNPQETYLSKGSSLTFVRSFTYLFVQKPRGYSVEKVKEIAERYKEPDSEKAIYNGETPNLIFIMNESLCDMSQVSNGAIKTNKDVMPVIHSLKDNTYKGTLYEERRGGGTAIMEFEALSGCTNAFFPIGTIAYQTLIREETPSLASQLVKEGYQGVIASHPHVATNYNRDKAYPLIGFKKTEFKETFTENGNAETYGHYVSDKASYQEILDDFEAFTAKSDDPFFAFQVTMQNHAPYEFNETTDIRITSEEYRSDSVEGYLNYAHESDKQIGELIKYFSNEKDPTLIVVFGDHAPRFETSYYKKLLGITEDLSDEEEMSFQKTPLIMWANYNIGTKDFGATSDNYMAGKIINALGLKKSGFQRYLDDLEREIPVINSLGYWDKNGNYYKIEDTKSPYFERINEYNMLVYNDIVDTDNRIEGFFE